MHSTPPASRHGATAAPAHGATAAADAVPLGPRPYTLTGGRTEGHVALAVEALVTTAAGRPAHSAALAPEHHLILHRCAAPASVAEISAALRVPLGVARVLVSDLAVQGLVDVNNPVPGQPGTALLERVLGGLRRL
ncbi:DUF742 domain-containing protein [Streptomyces monticola]|uniref:DUF742 domain-containing protein n=1 Tax=Streptomyces monticola TaxID=2666263 RepID=A0ABW2JE37_9ACTN